MLLDDDACEEEDGGGGGFELPGLEVAELEDFDNGGGDVLEVRGGAVLECDDDVVRGFEVLKRKDDELDNRVGTEEAGQYALRQVNFQTSSERSLATDLGQRRRYNLSVHDNIHIGWAAALPFDGPVPFDFPWVKGGTEAVQMLVVSFDERRRGIAHSSGALL